MNKHRDILTLVRFVLEASNTLIGLRVFFIIGFIVSGNFISYGIDSLELCAPAGNVLLAHDTCAVLEIGSSLQVYRESAYQAGLSKAVV